MSEYSGFILVNRNTWDYAFLSDVTGCLKSQVSDCTGSTAFHFPSCLARMIIVLSIDNRLTRCSDRRESEYNHWIFLVTSC